MYWFIVQERIVYDNNSYIISFKENMSKAKLIKPNDLLVYCFREDRKIKGIYEVKQKPKIVETMRDSTVTILIKPQIEIKSALDYREFTSADSIGDFDKCFILKSGLRKLSEDEYNNTYSKLLEKFLLEKSIVKDEVYFRELNERLELIKKLPKENREKTIKNSSGEPETIVVLSRIYKTNPYVIVETIERAKGRCERCGKKAPYKFKKGILKDLEVCYLTPFGDGGKDLLSNTKALCPNCAKKHK